MPKEFESFNILDVEIFATGTHNGDSFNEKDLDGIVSAFEKTKDTLKPFVKIGHSEKQNLLAEDELPAAGFVENLRRVGNKLVADFKKVPKKVFDVIKNGLFSRISSELFVNFKEKGQEGNEGEVFPLALKAVAILGGQTPAVGSLKDILDLGFFDVKEILALSKGAEIKEYGFENPHFNKNNTEEYKMTIEELQRQNMKLESDVKSFQEENAELQQDLKKEEDAKKEAEAKAQEADKKASESEVKLLAIEEESRKKEIEHSIDVMIKEGKLFPSQKEMAFALISGTRMNEAKKFTIGEKEYNNVQELLFAFVGAGKVDGLNMEEKSKRGEARGNEDEFIQRAEKYASENKVSIKDAILKLSPGHQA